MTAVVGIVEENGDIYMGADSAGVAGYSVTRRKDPKVFIKMKFIMGFTSSFRMGQLLHYKFSPPSLLKVKSGKQTLDHYMNVDFVQALRKCFKEGGFTTINNNKEIGGCFLVGIWGRLFEIESDFQVAESLKNYSAVGCGDDLCLGSLYSTDGLTNVTPEQRISLALSAAEEFSAGVRSPFNILRLENK